MKDYYKEAKSWYQEKYELTVIAFQWYRLATIALSVLLSLAILAIVIMMPLKEYVYRLIEVNQQTGEVTDLKEIDSHKYETNWVITRYFIGQYVANRHRYSFEDIKRSFNLVLAMSTKQIADTHIQETLDTNPKSPLNVLKRDYYRDVKILGINQLNDKTALVRFRTTTQHKNIATDTKIEDWQTVVKWEYVNSAESLQDRDKNPLGFMVSYYQVSPLFIENE